MGYSIGVRVRSQKLRAAMLEFMEKNYRSWPALNGEPDGDCYASGPTDDLSYDHAKSAIGIDYGVCGGWEREYAYTLIRWMALKVGARRRTFSNDLRTEQPVPFMVYDGYETWPIIVGTKAENKKLPKNIRWCAVDALGIHNDPNAEGNLVTYAMFDAPAFSHATERAMKKVGPYPEKGDRHAWRIRFNTALLKEPSIRKSVDKNIGLIRDELARLSKLWDAR